MRAWLSTANAEDAQPTTSKKINAGTIAKNGSQADQARSTARGGRQSNGVGSLDRDDEDDEDEDADMDDAEDDGDDLGDHSGRNDFSRNATAPVTTKGPPALDGPDPTEIQILELHSAEPVIAYRGMLFRGAWTETIGTEMLFAGSAADPAAHRPASVASLAPLPSAVHLTPAVDLIGASSARIACTATELRECKDAAAERAEEALKRKSRRRLGFSIPVGRGATEQRQHQAFFLESLMALKHGRGEHDVVTVQALEAKPSAEVHRGEEGGAVARRAQEQEDEAATPATNPPKHRLEEPESGAEGRSGHGEPMNEPRQTRQTRQTRQKRARPPIAGAGNDMSSADTGAA